MVYIHVTRRSYLVCLTAIDTVQQLLLSSPGIVFNKGLFYLLGVAIG